MKGPDGRPVGGYDKRYATRSNPMGRYDMIQREHQVNHLALVPAARGGGDLRVRMDEADYSVGMLEECAEPTLVVLTTSVDGHQHTLDPACSSGFTSRAMSEGADQSHCHEFVRTVDGKITIAENTGHTHDVDNTTLGLRQDAADDAAAGAKPAPQDPRRTNAAGFRRDSVSPAGGHVMDPAEQIRALQAQLADSEKIANERQVALVAAVARADGAEAIIKTITEERDGLAEQLKAGHQAMETAAIKEHATRADAAEAEVKELKDSVADQVRERCTVLVAAKMVLGDAFRLDEAERSTNREVQALVIKHLSPKDDVSKNVSDAFIASRFDSLIDSHKRTARSYERAGQTITADTQFRTDSAVTERQPSREERQDKWRNQWKQPLPSSQAARTGRKEA